MTSGFNEAHMQSVQGGTCTVCVYIFINVCIYRIPEWSVYWIWGAVHLCSLGMSASTRVTWHHNARGEKRGRDSFTAVLLLQVVPFFFFLLEEPLFLQFSDRRLESGVRGWIEWARGRNCPLPSSRATLTCAAAWKQTCSRSADRVISAACECTGLHRRLINYTWGPLDGIKSSFLLTCIKFYF